MPVSPSRQLAFSVLMEVELNEGYASDLLHSSLGRGLSLADRRLATEIVMGVLRWRAPIDQIIQRAANRPVEKMAAPALQALRMGVYQMRYLTRIPPSAAVDESVEAAKLADPKLSGFVNAVLRRIARETADVKVEEKTDDNDSHPAWLLDRWRARFGADAVTAAAAYDNRVPPVAIRATTEALPGEIVLAPGRLLAAARRVVEGDITKTEAYLQGQVWVQDEASQLIAHLLEPAARDRILDACAAPGGKAALLHALVPEAAMVAVEPRPQRARLLRRRLPPTAHVVAADATRELPFRWQFDRVLVDAPCTGTGTLSRNPEIRWRLQPDDAVRLAELQTAIVTHAAIALRPGGRLVYSVCSLEAEEGPGVVSRLLASDPKLTLVSAARVLNSLRSAGVLVDNVPPIDQLTQGGFFQILPGAAETDGFFAAIIERAR
ncbi:MAG TPA: 16S rRNA (cytosine(967)-C(5))-methyltransferase RsmB [Terriglobales bacterium]